MILLILLILFAPIAGAETFVVEREDGGVTIIESVIPDGLDQHLEANNLQGRPVKKIKASDIPPDKTYRDAWVMNPSAVGKKIMVDQQKKKDIDDAKTAKQAEKQAVLQKLGITEEELGVIRAIKGG